MMNDMINREIQDLQKVKKSRMPMPNYVIHLYFANELLLDVEVRDYDQIKSHRRYEGGAQAKNKRAGTSWDGKESGHFKH